MTPREIAPGSRGGRAVRSRRSNQPGAHGRYSPFRWDRWYLGPTRPSRAGPIRAWPRAGTTPASRRWRRRGTDGAVATNLQSTALPVTASLAGAHGGFGVKPPDDRVDDCGRARRCGTGSELNATRVTIARDEGTDGEWRTNSTRGGVAARVHRGDVRCLLADASAGGSPPPTRAGRRPRRLHDGLPSEVLGPELQRGARPGDRAPPEWRSVVSPGARSGRRWRRLLSRVPRRKFGGTNSVRRVRFAWQPRGVNGHGGRWPNR